ncbi:MAG: hypothetical protein N2378_15100 [Chloroflexaceae bacterium]|nr:hypothetical protein [Chloroflexaceae bacterium]
MGTPKIAQPRAAARSAGNAALAWLRAEARGLVHPYLGAVLAALALVFLLVPHLPFHYRIDAGYEEGIGSDLPFLRGFNGAERGDYGTFRWTAGQSAIHVPGVGRRGLLVALTLLPVSATPGPQELTVFAGGQALATLPVRPAGGRYWLIAPPATQADGTLHLTLNSPTFSPPDDPRRLGVPLGLVTVTALPAGLVAPAWGPLGLWLGATVLAWMSVRHALGAPYPPREHPRGTPPVRTFLTVGLLAGLLALAALLDPPRWAFGAGAALTACALAYPLAIVVRRALPSLAERLNVPLDATSLRWLTFIIILSFALRYGGRLYPDSMHGDIGFHHNRFNDMVWGLIFIVSRNRGVDFPYPPGPYTIVAPLTLIGLHPRTLLQLSAALVDALSAAVVYAIAARVTGQRTALLAAGIYVFTAATFMTTWWAFMTHIYTQFFHLLLIAALTLAFPAWQSEGSNARRWWTLSVGLLLSMVFLGHFGFLINTALLVTGLTLTLWAASWRATWARRVRWPLTLAVVGAGALALVFFYSAYAPMFLNQFQTAREGGLNAVAGREPANRALMWQNLWRNGFVIHFGLFPLLLMPWGIWRLWRATRADAPGSGPRRVVLWLALGSLAVAVVFAAFPFVAGVTNSPRWLMFIAWVVALGAALAVEALWRRGWWARLLVGLMGACALANTAWFWIAPMLWRVRPPEPF